MARMLLDTGSPQLDVSSLTAKGSSATSPLSPEAIELRLRKKRSMAYIEAIRRLDASGHTCSREVLEEFLAAIQKELPEISIDHIPVGIVAKCYLGPPHEVHTLDRAGQIIRHYKTFESLPPLLEGGRSLARHPNYAFIEVYTDKLIAVAANGDTSIVRG